jgi:hypothetical protein
MNRASPPPPFPPPQAGRVGLGAPDWLTVIQGHPDPNGNRLCHAIADAYAEGARRAGRELRRVELLYPASLINGKKLAKTKER